MEPGSESLPHAWEARDRRDPSDTFDNNDADVVAGGRKIESTSLDCFENLVRRKGVDLTQHLFQVLREILLVTSGMLQQAIGVQQQNASGTHESPRIQSRTVFETDCAVR